jgi:general secretion pathway protein H
MLGNTIDHSRVKSATRELAAGLQAARMQAINSRAEATLVLNTELKTYKVDDREKRLQLPTASGLLLTTAESEQIDEYSGAIRFYPDGSSTGGQIKLSLPDRVAYDIDVNWLTGNVTITP